MVDIPEYETYSLLDLYQVLNNIRSDLYPDIYEALLKEIDRIDEQHWMVSPNQNLELAQLIR